MVYSFGLIPPDGVRYGARFGEGGFSDIRLEDETPDGGWRFDYANQSATSMGRRIRTGHVPARMIWEAPPGTPIPDFEGSYFLNVSDRARAVIESVEPGVHQFLPVDYLDEAGSLVEHRYMFVICNRIDSVDRDHTTMILLRGVIWMPFRTVLNSFPDDVPPGYDVSQEQKLVFSEAKARGCHVWIDKHLKDAKLLSDRMAEAIRSSDLTGIEISKRETV